MSKRNILYSGFITVEEAENGFEVVRSTDSVAVLVYDEDRESIIFVTEFRPAMVSDDNPSGMMSGVPAGRFDEEISIKGLVVKEIKEEAGVSAREDQVEVLNFGLPIALSPGILTEKVYLAYVRVGSEQIEKEDRVFGNIEEGEHIKRTFIPISELSSMTVDSITTWALIQWFLKEHR